jgi:hypothetical protein
MCISEIGNAFFVVDTTDMREKVAVFCDRQMEFGGRAAEAFKFLAENSSCGSRLGAFALASKADIIQLQLADLVAYECKKLVENTVFDPSRAMRWPMRQLQRRHPFACSFLDLSGRALARDIEGNENTLLRIFHLNLVDGQFRIQTAGVKDWLIQDTPTRQEDIKKLTEFLRKNLDEPSEDKGEK